MYMCVDIYTQTVMCYLMMGIHSEKCIIILTTLSLGEYQSILIHTKTVGVSLGDMGPLWDHYHT
jgi:hypothetical protein